MIFFVVALSCEARPLIDEYRLKSTSYVRPFRVYCNDDVHLVISGVGKIASAAATAYLYAIAQQPNQQIWINVGVGGHRDYALGTSVIAHKITDGSRCESWYPPLISDIPCPTEEVVTVDKSEEQYPLPVIYEMEAAGFYCTATRFSTAELVHCYKVVSDNHYTPLVHLTKNSVTELIATGVKSLQAFLDTLSSVHADIEKAEQIPSEWEQFIQNWRFTHTQRQNLRQLLQRWQTIFPKRQAWCEELTRKKSAKEVLHFLRERLESVPISYSNTQEN